MRFYTVVLFVLGLVVGFGLCTLIVNRRDRDLNEKMALQLERHILSKINEIRIAIKGGGGTNSVVLIIDRWEIQVKQRIEGANVENVDTEIHTANELSHPLISQGQ